MATGGESSFYMSENYIGTRRGREASGDFSFEMFPEKYEATHMEEDPEQVDQSWRDTLMDLSPEAPTFAHEAARRNPYSKDFLNLRDGGSRVTTDPWKNEDYDTQLHDKDPRGWSTEQNWAEYRRVMENKMSQIDFRDDGDYSVPSQGIHPNTMYKNIKSAFYWTKDRMKWFATSKDAWHNGGTGLQIKQRDAKAVGFTDIEDTSSMVDPRYMEAEGRSHKTTQLSNIVNTGSKFLRANTTTDQEVKVAGYGKLYKSRGLIPHEKQLRETEDDRKMSKLEGMQATPTNLVALMAAGAKGNTSAETARYMLQDAIGSANRFPGVSEQQDTNRGRKLTNDILSLLGFTPQEVKWLDSYKSVNRKAADHMQAQLMELTEMVHAMPAHMKLAMRDELLMASLGKGLTPADPTQLRRARDNSIINPKLVKYMDLMVRQTEKPGDPETARRMGWADPENKLSGIFANGQLFSTRGKYLGEGDVDANRWDVDQETGRFAGKKGEAKTKSYAALARNSGNYMKNRQGGVSLQELQDTMTRVLGKSFNFSDTRIANRNDTAEDNEFGENKYQDRHGGKMGSKYMRRHMDTDEEDCDWEEDGMREHGHLERATGLKA